VRHFTPDNVRRMLSRKGIESARLTGQRGNVELRVSTATPLVQLLLTVLSFSHSRTHGFFYRRWTSSEATR